MKQNGIVIEGAVVGRVSTNCYVVHREGCDRCVVIDPGDKGDRIGSMIQSQGLVLEDILLTHGHFDHMHGVDELIDICGGRVCVYEEEKEVLGDARMNMSVLTERPVSLEADVLLHDGQVYESADMKFQVIHTPGHTKGSCCFYLEQEKILFCGDTLFFESIGRSDFPTGDGITLRNSVKRRVFMLPDDVRAYTGHGLATSIGYEKENNPFIS